MRLAVLLDRWRHDRGGLEAYLTRVLPVLARRHEVFLVARDAGREPPEGCTGAAAAARLPWPRPWRDLADSRAQRRAAAALRADRVLTLRRTAFPGALWQPHGGSAPHSRRARGAARPGWRERVFERAEEATLAQCAGVLAVSPKVARECTERRPGVPVAVLPPPLPPAAAAVPSAGVPAPPAARAPIGFCGWDARAKGAPQAVRWFEALRPALPGAPLHLWSRSVAHLERVLGAGRAELEARGVMLRGWDGRFRGELPGMQLFLLPTLYDACSLACLEAAAAGVPVLTTRENGFAELVGAPQAAVAPRADPAAAAAAARDLLAARRAAAASDWAAAARALADRFSLEKHAALLQEILEEGIPTP